MPRTGFRKQPPEMMEDETGAQIPNPLRDEWVPPPRDDLQVQGLKLGCNMLTSLPPVFNIVIREVMEKPRNLSWIDLSFNQLEEVPQVTLAIIPTCSAPRPNSTAQQAPRRPPTPSPLTAFHQERVTGKGSPFLTTSQFQ